MEVDRPSPVPEDKCGFNSSPHWINLVKYKQPETSAWIAKEADAYWESLNDSNKQEFLAVSDTNLLNFARDVIQDPWLVDFLPNAITLYKLHGTWETYVCPDLTCSRLFKDVDSLIIHLKRDHFSDICPVAWSPRRHNLAEERQCADALRKMVWKPIVVDAALDLLSTICLDHEHVTMADVCAGSDRLNSLDWLFSEDLERKRLLLELEEGFQVLLAKQEQASFSLISDGFFMTMTAMASEHIFVDHPRRYNLCFLQCILAHSPLSFCMLEERHLPQFVKLVKVMTQLVEQAPLHSVNRELDSAECDFSWRKSVILDAPYVSFQDGSLRYDGGDSILSSLCSAPSIPSIKIVHNKAPVIFSDVQKILYQMRSAGLALDRLQPWCMLGISAPLSVCRRLSEIYFTAYGIFLTVTKTYYVEPTQLQLRLYVCLRCRGLEVDEENPIAQCPMISHQEENVEQKVSSDERKSEYGSDYDTDESYFDISDNSDESGSGENSDCEDGSKSSTKSEPETESKLDPELGDKPWREDPVLCGLDSTLSASATGKTADTGPFFWMAISDILRHCARDPSPVGLESVLEGLRRFRLNKTWKYWLCYSCDKTFIDRESHMVHLEDKHQFGLAHEYWLIPKQAYQDEVEDLRQDEVKSEGGLEDSITLDHMYRYFLVDSTKLFDQIPSANEKKELGQAKRKEYMEIVGGLHSELRHLRCLFRTKCECLVYLEIVNALSLMLFNGGQPLALLVIWLHKLSTMDRRTSTTHQLQFRFLSQLLCQAHDQRYGPLSNYSVQNAFQNMRDDLISKIDWQDEKILEALVRIDDIKRNLSDLCVGDYRTEIVPSVRSFLHAKFRFDDSLRSLGCNNIKELLSSLDQDYIRSNPRYFSAGVRSPGEWPSSIGSKPKIDGNFKYGGWFTLPPGCYKNVGGVIPGNGKPYGSIESVGIYLNYYLCAAVGRKFHFLLEKYSEQNE
ncbi:hypothetical protein FCM35_KLT15566 [Carex littledalei]|uniref:C2H2-type domain-containing protein n=1 Tax=Carex littledalei TaxID=544730 RepID=A0A833VS78_9POAL|nr:hypothetical protein FCM35_KLT15566 [Carex littledalei]